MNQQPQRIEFIPIREIRIVNPRTRNKVTFQNIVANIRNVGLKKPITVCQRELDVDGTKYDLVCGQGRLEAFVALGDSKIPAIVSDAPPEGPDPVDVVPRSRAEYLFSSAINLAAAFGVRTPVVTIALFSSFFP